MIAKVWYTVNYFRFSFGKLDKLADGVETVIEELNCEKDIDQVKLTELIKENLNRKEIKKYVQNLSRFVPYRFISPWFAAELRGLPDQKKDKTIAELAAQNFMKSNNPPPYRFDTEKGTIVLHPNWRDYFRKHVLSLRGYTLWHLLDFLQISFPEPSGRPFNR